MSDLVKCPFCAEEINKDATVCKHCNKKLSKGGKKPKGCLFYMGIGFLIIFGLGVLGNIMDPDGSKKAERNKISQQQAVKEKENRKIAEAQAKENKINSAIHITATRLFSNYEANEIAADNEYKGNNVVVTGYISNIGKDILGSMYVSLKTDNIIGSVQCMFSKEYNQQLSNLSKGEKVSIFGKVDGKLGNVLINDSELQ